MTVDRYLRMIAGAIVLLTLRSRLLGRVRTGICLHGIRRAQPVSIGFHQLVPDDDDPSETGRPRQLKLPLRPFSCRPALTEEGSL